MNYYAVHMKNIETGQRRVRRIEAEDVDAATDKAGFSAESPWRWTGSEPWKNVADEAEHLGGGYYALPDWNMDR